MMRSEDPAEAIFITLDESDFRRLVAGRPVVHQVAGHRVEIQQETISAREMIAAVLAAMGDDPPEAAEFLPRGTRRPWKSSKRR